MSNASITLIALGVVAFFLVTELLVVMALNIKKNPLEIATPLGALLLLSCGPTQLMSNTTTASKASCR